MRRGHSYIVVGAGALGSAAAYWLTRSGATDVLVLEQYGLGHGHGASEDHSRIIRHAYHSSVYTALTRAAYDAWAEIEGETGLQLVFKTGGLDLAVAGTAGEADLGNYRGSLAPFGIPSEDLDAAEIRRRWPVWRIGGPSGAIRLSTGYCAARTPAHCWSSNPGASHPVFSSCAS